MKETREHNIKKQTNKQTKKTSSHLTKIEKNESAQKNNDKGKTQRQITNGKQRRNYNRDKLMY